MTKHVKEKNLTEGKVSRNFSNEFIIFFIRYLTSGSTDVITGEETGLIKHLKVQSYV